MPPKKSVPTSNPTMKKVNLVLRPQPADETKVNLILKKSTQPPAGTRVPGAYVYKGGTVGGGMNYA